MEAGTGKILVGKSKLEEILFRRIFSRKFSLVMADELNIDSIIARLLEGNTVY